MNKSIKTLFVLIWLDLTSAQSFWDPLGIFTENHIQSTTTELPILTRTSDFNSSYIIVGKLPSKIA